jgi:tRNA pseudouridine65 synthase
MRTALSILHRDDALVVVNKPSGLLVHRGGWGDDDEVAMTLVRQQVGCHVFPVHRLDRATSGALVFALSPEDARRVQEQWEGRTTKRYVALVRGIPPEQGVVDHAIPNKPDGPRVAAVTHFMRRFSFDRYAVIEARPETGRLHQIRRHMKHMSHPLIGDVNYGKGEHNRLFRDRYGLCRLALHALSIELVHPRTGQPLRIVAPPPADLAEPFRAMGIPEFVWSPLETCRS